MQLNTRSRSAETGYLEMLKAASVEELEERVVSLLLESLSDQIAQKRLPIRLSKIAHYFHIEPKPKMITGLHDGELRFDSAKSKFIINLCTPEPAIRNRSAGRQRFTYAHEMAHRFFFVPQQEGWTRAIDLATSTVPSDLKMQVRRRLNEIEESLCNRIAHRVLMPDKLLSERCNLDAWFDLKEGFYRSFSETANNFGVSRECFIVGIRDAFRRKVLQREAVEQNSCVLVISKTGGPLNRRNKLAVRVSVSIFPRELDSRTLRAPFPGYELRRFGKEFEEFFDSVIGLSDTSEGSVNLPLSLTVTKPNDSPVAGRLIGWWKSYGSGSSQYRRVCVWGRLAIT